MGRGKSSQEEIIALNINHVVVSANENRIIYTNEFKFHFMEKYNNGVWPRKIFSDAGFDVLALGYKRIERAVARWKQSYTAGTLWAYYDPQIRNEKAIKDRVEKAEHPVEHAYDDSAVLGLPKIDVIVVLGGGSIGGVNDFDLIVLNTISNAGLRAGLKYYIKTKKTNAVEKYAKKEYEGDF